MRVSLPKLRPNHRIDLRLEGASEVALGVQTALAELHVYCSEGIIINLNISAHPLRIHISWYTGQSDVKIKGEGESEDRGGFWEDEGAGNL